MYSPKEGIIERVEYQRDIKKFRLHQKNEGKLVDSIKRWLSGGSDLLTPIENNKLIITSDDLNIKAFAVRLPSADFGKSGGYRLIMIYKIKEHVAEIGRIFKRKDLKYKGSKGKKTKEYEKYIQELRKEFNPKIKTQNTPDITITK